MKFDENKLELLVNDSHGVYIPKVFFDAYRPYIEKWYRLNPDCKYTFEQLEKDINIDPNSGEDFEAHIEAWNFICDFYGSGFRLINDDGIPMRIEQQGDVWAYPEDMEFPEDYWS